MAGLKPVVQIGDGRLDVLAVDVRPILGIPLSARKAASFSHTAM